VLVAPSMSKSDNWLHGHHLSQASIIIEAILNDGMSHASISSRLGHGEQNPILHCLVVMVLPTGSSRHRVTGRGGSRHEDSIRS
jgi:hypothetical protein